jgi:hypothetical protein
MLFTLIGCDKKDIVSPVEDPVDLSATQKYAEPDWISLPEMVENTSNGDISASKFIRADKREFITLSRKYEGGKLGSVSIACVVVIPVGALEDDMTLTLTMNEEKGYITIQPDLEFKVPVKFTMIYKGLDLQNFNIESLEFINFDDSYGEKVITSSRMKINEDSGTIGVYEAEIRGGLKFGFTS